MPIYNTSFFLQDSIKSILTQNYANFELIIINDGSTKQEGVNWLKNCSDSRIKLINNSHDFIKTLNKGIEVAKGKYVVRMDTDDIMLSNRLQKQYEFMGKHVEVDVYGTWMELFGASYGTIRNLVSHEQVIVSMLSSNPLSHPTAIIRKAFLNNKGVKGYIDGYPYAEDYKLWTEMAIKEYCFANIPEVLLKYRVSDKQVTQLHKTEMSKSSLNIQHEYLEWAMEYIVGNKTGMELILNELIDTVNNQTLSIKKLMDTVSSVFLEMLQLEE